MPPMRDVTPRNVMPEPIEHLPEAPMPGTRTEPDPAPRRTPSGTRIVRSD